MDKYDFCYRLNQGFEDDDASNISKEDILKIKSLQFFKRHKGFVKISLGEDEKLYREDTPYSHQCSVFTEWEDGTRRIVGYGRRIKSQ